MTIDLSGGLDPAREYVFADQPADPEMRESVNAWIWDRGTDVGMPRIGVEAVADQWDTHDIQVNVTLSGGRVLNLHAPGKVHPATGSDGAPRVLGAGPLSFELLQPFTRWRMVLDGEASETTVGHQMRAVAPDDPRVVAVRAEIDIVSAVPPWEQGALLPEAKHVLDTQDEGAVMGGPRFEQLSRATGTLRVDGREYPIDGGALRVRRQGVRRLGTFRGHVWQSALFPDGRAFGFIVYPRREDGLPTYNEGYVFSGDGELQPAWVIDAPWLRRLVPSDEDVSTVLETASGTVRIGGVTALSNFSVMGGVGANPDWPVLQQAIVRYTWDGETVTGMMERSTRGDQIEA